MIESAVYRDLLAVVRVEQERLLTAAKGAEHEFREAHFRARSQLHWKEWGTYMPYLRMRAAGIGCLWGIMTFHGPQTKRQVRLKEFGRKAKWRYTPAQFPDAKAWEVEAIEKAEEVFERVRRRTAFLAKIVQVTKGAAATEGVRLAGKAEGRTAAINTEAEGYRSVLDDWVPPSRLQCEPEQGE
ncbi:conjugative transfer protein MobI(A/C) [Azospirillum griseum]|uniref:Uncharacterized protein n=1 Tax=Azospirillum griseum TaxID=2496639 RepID=A0A431VAV9_9PROT|nr:conjugative transfer protein MobI(A/C) [Azospirillum griseum]RTR15524.1 hypothetical protein EJ903_22985 [Azospirillum griseum]